MPLEHHPLSREFPEYLQQLRALHASDAHFARQTEAYEALDKRIYEVEDGRQAMDCLLYTSPSQREKRQYRMPSSD